ncbi:TetR family transcriptional regulator [Nocardia beijingensis]|uniref:TetR/AcrR family transcriptional regulator n=1 Tax=Nocardia beijingensis TaxID=95162 RepID=UPI0018961550|nr:TetR family transcriptional regulator [Nocardia beijingensis]MBF6076211.1 TetR family transcriptional regulator [Nocardia beijingensis]
MSTDDRRALLADTAIELIATRGLRALTHRALDTALGLPVGSASYYFRTKRALIEAVVDRITTRSRDDFAAAALTPTAAAQPAAEAIAAWLDRLLAERRAHLIARHALLIDLLDDPGLRPRLVHSLFSVDRACDLFRVMGAPDPDTRAEDFVAVIEGAVFDRFAGHRSGLRPGTPESVRQLARVLATQLRM